MVYKIILRCFFTRCFFDLLSCGMYMSINLNWDKSGASNGSTNSFPRFFLKYRYDHLISSNIILLWYWENSLIVFLKRLSQYCRRTWPCYVSFAWRHCHNRWSFHSQTFTTSLQADLVAVAVKANIHTEFGNKGLTSAILNCTVWKFHPIS